MFEFNHTGISASYWISRICWTFVNTHTKQTLHVLLLWQVWFVWGHVSHRDDGSEDGRRNDWKPGQQESSQLWTSYQGTVPSNENSNLSVIKTEPIFLNSNVLLWLHCLVKLVFIINSIINHLVLSYLLSCVRSRKVPLRWKTSVFLNSSGS